MGGQGRGTGISACDLIEITGAMRSSPAWLALHFAHRHGLLSTLVVRGAVTTLQRGVRPYLPLLMCKDNRHFDSAAVDYAAMMTEPWHLLRLRSALANIRRVTRISGTWIDLGAGTGEGSALLAAAGSESSTFALHVLAADPSPSMGRSLVALAQRTPGLSVIEPSELDQWRAEATGVLLHNVVEYSSDRAALIDMAAQCLRPRGLMSVLCTNPGFALYQLAVRGATPTTLRTESRRSGVTVGMPQERFVVPAFSITECIDTASELGLTLIDHRGVRVLSDFAAGHPSQRAAGWVDEMLDVEDLLGGLEPYRSTSRHWQLIFRKGPARRAG